MATVAVVLVTLVAIVVSPGGHHEWVHTAVGVVVLAAIGAVSVPDTAAVMVETAPVCWTVRPSSGRSSR